MAREFLDVDFERYVDDAVVHCATEHQARHVLAALQERMSEVGLALHPDKTRVVYCKDARRRGSHEHTSFTFLGYGFRAGGYGRGADGSRPVRAENLCHLGRCTSSRRRLGAASGTWAGRQCRPGGGCDDSRLVGLKLIFLIVSRAVPLLRLSRRESWWKDAEILMLRHQLSVALRERPRAH